MKFIDTQQALVTEEKQKRLEREQVQKDKKRQERQELELFFTIDNILNNTPESKKINVIKEISKPKNRDMIIDRVTNNNNLQDIYILTKKYNKILTQAYNGYKYTDKDISEAEKEKAKKCELKLFRILRNTLDFKEYHSKTNNIYFKSNEEIYQFLSTPTQKDYIINTVTNDIETIYILNKKYMAILNNLYKPYKTQEHTKKKQTIKSTPQTKTKAKNGNGFINILLTAFISIIIISTKIIAYFIITPLILIFKR